VTARVFVASVARHFGVRDEVVEDLRLAASELFTNAAENAGDSVRFAFVRGDGALALHVVGAGDLDASERNEPLEVRRLDVLLGLFPGLRLSDNSVVEIDLPTA
jgi:anti-sigma regulatory factor (Ser/Thr protein kinase)